MAFEFGLTTELVNTQFAPVAALAAYYEGQKVLQPLDFVIPRGEKRDFSLSNQLGRTALNRGRCFERD